MNKYLASDIGHELLLSVYGVHGRRVCVCVCVYVSAASCQMEFTWPTHRSIAVVCTADFRQQRFVANFYD